MSRVFVLLTVLFSSAAAIAGPFEEGLAALERGRFSRALELITEAAEADQGEAQLLLGKMYLDGQGVAADPEKAVKWLERAAYNKVREASLLLGKIYASGMGVEMDAERSAAYLRQAADQVTPEDDDEDCE